jgi:hypothetical protein
MDALSKVNTRRVIQKLQEECSQRLMHDLFTNDLHNCESIIKDTCEYFKDKNMIYDYGVTDCKTVTYHSYEFIRKNRRYYIRPFVIDQNEFITYADDVKCRSKRHAVKLWKDGMIGKELMWVDLLIKPVLPCNYIQLKYTIKRNRNINEN